MVEQSPISMSNYLDYSEYLSTGIQRLARLAPQVELETTPRSAVPRPIVFVPPKSNTVPSYYPSYLVFGEPNEVCTQREFAAGKC